MTADELTKRLRGGEHMRPTWYRDSPGHHDCYFYIEANMLCERRHGTPHVQGRAEIDTMARMVRFFGSDWERVAAG